MTHRRSNGPITSRYCRDIAADRKISSAPVTDAEVKSSIENTKDALATYEANKPAAAAPLAPREEAILDAAKSGYKAALEQHSIFTKSMDAKAKAEADRDLLLAIKLQNEEIDLFLKAPLRK